MLKPLLLSTYPAGRSAAFADFFEANVLPILSSRLKATPRSMPALQSLQPRNTSDHSQQACLTAPATLPRQVARYHVLENPVVSYFAPGSELVFSGSAGTAGWSSTCFSGVYLTAPSGNRSVIIPITASPPFVTKNLPTFSK